MALSSNVTLSAAVMTHPRRRQAAVALRDRHPDLDPVIVEDPEPDGPPSALRAARLAWQSVRDDATHHLVVQDDMILVDGFAEQVRRAAAAMPDEVLCFFTEWGSRSSHALRLACLEGSSWVPVIDPYIPTTAVLLPAGIARKLAAFADEVTDPSAPDDVVLLDYVREHDLVPYLSVPNLAEHATSDSLMGNDLIMGPRQAALFAGELDRLPAVSSTVSRPLVIPHLRIFEGYSVCHVRDSGTSNDWEVMKTSDHLAPFGITVAQILAWFIAAMAEHDRAGRVRDLIGEPLLLQLWLTAFAYGMVASPLIADGRSLDAALADPLAAAGLRTLAPGALRRFVPVSLIGRLPTLVEPVVQGGIRAGFAAAREVGYPRLG